MRTSNIALACLFPAALLSCRAAGSSAAVETPYAASPADRGARPESDPGAGRRQPASEPAAAYESGGGSPRSSTGAWSGWDDVARVDGTLWASDHQPAASLEEISSRPPAGEIAPDARDLHLPERGETEKPLGGLVEEIEERLEGRWRELQWEEGTEPTAELRGIERSLVALSFLKPASAARELPRAAIEELRSPGATMESRLLAAAFLERAGLPTERNVILREILAEIDAEGATGAPRERAGGEGGAEIDVAARAPRAPSVPEGEANAAPSPAIAETAELALEDRAEEPRQPPAAPAGSFRLAEVAFVTEINELGTYTAREDHTFRAGEKALIYGEFIGFVEAVEPGAEERALYVRRFSGSLALIDRAGRVVDSGTFLSPERGVSRNGKPLESINFWAEYRFPHDLAPGHYELRVDARDHEGSQRAAATLPVEITAPSRR